MNIYVEIPRGITRDTFLTERNIRLLESLGHVTWNESDRHCTEAEFARALAGQDVCVGCWGLPKFTDAVLSQAKDLKLIAYTGGSVNGVANEGLYARGIRISCGNEAFAESVAEGTLAYMETALRQIPLCLEDFRANGWPETDDRFIPTQSLMDQTVGLVGLGSITRYLIRFLKPFRVKLKICSGHASRDEIAALGAEKAELEEIFSTCKIVSIHLARSERNYHIIGDSLLRRLDPGAILINTARGDIIDEEALVRCLQEKRFRAVLDVYEQEPLPLTHPLLDCPNAILMPHRGGPTTDRREAAGRLAIEDIALLAQGKPLKSEVSRERASQMTKQ